MTASPAILNAVITVIATRGLEETSVRTVAAEAGVSIGAVQHHFGTKAELLTAAMEFVTGKFVAQMQDRLDSTVNPADALREFLYLLAVVEDDGMPAARVWLAFAAKAAVDPQIRDLHTREWDRTEQALTGFVTAAHPKLENPQLVARTLLAVADGVAVARAAENPGRMSADEARAVIDHALSPRRS